MLIQNKDIVGVYRVSFTPKKINVGLLTKGGAKIDISVLFEDYPEIGEYVDNFSKELRKKLEV